MRVFVTGASGFVGSAIVAELLSAGHQVLGLARSEPGVAAVAAAGAQPRPGSLEDLAGLREAAACADAVVHTAFNHDFSRFAESCETDRRAIEALGDALVGTRKPLLVTSGVALVAPGRLSTEADHVVAARDGFPRVSEAASDAQAERGVLASVVRLPPSVHGDGDHGFVPILGGIARDRGVSAWIGEGRNRWPAVHRLDAARVYRLALERPERGARWHAVAEEGVPFREIAEAIARQVGVPARPIAPEAAAAHFGWFARFAAVDTPSASARTRERLGWTPMQVGLLADIDRPAYFPAPSRA